ncbi:MerR family transcriptional regulator [Mobilicoccus pelagius]|uniref:Putative MerR family transcriptional regulator n=1 Tax=Mobilicoccus pelagius NBRC 104925 TaxID=1089455 RepID=H5UMM6_9MICO|nr:MerR family transcriptional regulator [Mobilicoccus pelagius]GAB46984.1 putative MerR family transcriptional regulator [Mobilicoccus pelagius NBRC 104925]
MTETEHEFDEPMTVGQVAQRLGITRRTLHHYDEIGLVTPSVRSHAGYRLYTDGDLTRLQHVVVYRRLGFGLEEIADLLDRPDGLVEHLHRQRASVMSRLDELRGLVTALDHALENAMTDTPMTDDEKRELFGDALGEEYVAEAEQRWGDTDAWAQSRRRTAGFTKADWERIKAEGDAVNAEFARLLAAGAPVDSDEAAAAAEAHRRSIESHFDCTHEMQAQIASMYVGDPRFTAQYEAIAPGLAQYVYDAVRANAERHRT